MKADDRRDIFVESVILHCWVDTNATPRKHRFPLFREFSIQVVKLQRMFADQQKMPVVDSLSSKKARKRQGKLDRKLAAQQKLVWRLCEQYLNEFVVKERGQTSKDADALMAVVKNKLTKAMTDMRKLFKESAKTPGLNDVSPGKNARNDVKSNAVKNSVPPILW